MEEEKKNVLLGFFEQLNSEEKALIRDYLQDKKLESLSKSFDSLIEGQENEIRKD